VQRTIEKTNVGQINIEELPNNEQYGEALSKRKQILETGGLEWDEYLQLRRELAESNQANIHPYFY